MIASKYQELAMRTNDGKAKVRLVKKVVENKDIDVAGVLNSCLGISGETGELNDMIKKWVFHEKDIDITHVKKEIGDIQWYIAMMCDAFGFSMDEIMEMNIDKLKARYPEGFDVVRANNRSAGDV